jgi:multidrug efflux pump subunit AcrB
MKAAIEWMARNAVAANILLIFIFAGGVYSALNITQEVFPDIETNRINISGSYPGAGPSEVENSLCKPIESAIVEIQGIEQSVCTAREEKASISIELEKGVDLQTTLQDIKNAVDSINNFPDDIDRPTVSKQIRRRGLIDLILYGDVPEEALFEYAYLLQSDLLKIDGITYAEISGTRPKEILVEITPENLTHYDLSLDSLAAIMKNTSLDIPGGSVKVGSGSILLRTTAKRDTVEQFSEIPIYNNQAGTVLKLGDIATIKEQLTEASSFAMLNGKHAAIISIYQDKNFTPQELSIKVHAYLDNYKKSIPNSIKFEVWSDRSEHFKSRFDLLLKNAGIGITLVFLVLAFFLEIRLAFWVMLGMAVSYLGSLIILPYTDVTIHMNSMFAFILVSGIVVDDAIVVGENIFRYREEGKPFLEAAIEGCQHMAAPVTFAILTTICAFAPMLYIEGHMGQFIYAIPVIVIAVLSISLLECLFILPAHLAHGSKKPLGGPFLIFEYIRKKSDRAIKQFISGPFERVVRSTLQNRYITISTGFVFLLISLGFIGGGIIPMQFFPKIESDTVQLTIELPSGYPAENTIKIIKEVEKLGKDFIDKMDREANNGFKSYDHIYSSVQMKSRRTRSQNTILSVRMRFRGEHERNIEPFVFARQWRRMISNKPEVISVNLRSRMMSFGDDIRISLSHSNSELLKKAAQELKDHLASYEGIKDIVDSETGGNREYRFTLTDEAKAMGITPALFASKIRSAFQGIDVLTIPKDTEDVNVALLFPKSYRENITTLDTMQIAAPNGESITLRDAVIIEEGIEPVAIRRVDGLRVIEITAGFEENVENTDEVTIAIQENYVPVIEGLYPGITVKIRGSHENRAKSLNSLLFGFITALVTIYALLAIFFKSYIQPAIVMIAIPFGIAGAIGGHFVLGHPVSFMSIFGLVGLTGVVVNDALILIDAINRHPQKNENIFETLVAASKLRFRPIVLTSVTTFAGLTPILMETSRQAQFMIPTVISLGVGILFATIITLLLVPAIYFVMHDLREIYR